MDKQEVGIEHPGLRSSIFVQEVRSEGVDQVAKTQLGVILPTAHSLWIWILLLLLNLVQ